jgi:hypothetical protein
MLGKFCQKLATQLVLHVVITIIELFYMSVNVFFQLLELWVRLPLS